MAFVLPSWSSNAEMLKNSFNLIECLGIYWVLQQKSVNMDSKVNKILVVAIGWSLAESLFNTTLVLCLQAS